MAITLFCYVAQDQEETQETIKNLRNDHGELLTAIFLLSDALAVSDIEKRIALEYGFSAITLFLMRLNEKDQVERMEEAENIVKEAFGKENILILWENELKH
jgi:hypothetical protein